MAWEYIIKSKCAMCEKPAKFADENLPVGLRRFCSEKCWAEYSGMEVKPEGYYGFV